jgi:glutamate synthase (NADPH/NADH) small chain
MSQSVFARLRISAQPEDKQPPDVRVRNWEEVAQGLDLQRARLEAARCIHCPSQPCVEACPVHNDIPGALLLLENGDYLGAAAKFRETSNLPEMCGRLCPHERLCEGVCPVGFAIRPDGRKEPPVGIGQLEAFVADRQREELGGFPLPKDLAPPSGHRVAVVGSGPSGLTVAEELAKRGHEVTVFDQWPTPGGALAHGIPNFKMAKRILQQKLQYLTMLGVDFVTNVKVGRDLTIDDLFDQEFEAVYLGTGPGIDRQLRIPGADRYPEIVPVTDFLLRANATAGRLLAAPEGDGARIDRANGPAVIVIGGNDAALDAVRAALRLGASSVTVAFNGTRDEMMARAEEEEEARAEGVVFRFSVEPIAFLGNDEGHLTGVRFARVEQVTINKSGRRRTFLAPDSEFVLPADLVILSLGYESDPLMSEVTVDVRGAERDFEELGAEAGRTGRRGVFAGGDLVGQKGLVVSAMAAGKRVAAAIDAYLRELDNERLQQALHRQQLAAPNGNGHAEGHDRRRFRLFRRT